MQNPTDSCTSQPLQDVEVRASGVHGQGVFACRALPRGHVVGAYAGRRYSAEEALARDWDNARTYVFALSDGSYVDGHEGGNHTRLINHSCAPNCRAVEVRHDDGRREILIETRRRLRVGEELSLDYRLDVGDDDPAAYRCRCGSRRCRGSMAQPSAREP
jgi:SET domain-containing protein